MIRSIQQYGAPAAGWSNGKTVKDPTRAIDASNFTLMARDLAQLNALQTCALLEFSLATPPVKTAGVFTSVWGDDASVLAQVSVTRTSAGVFEVVWPSTLNDEIGNAQSVTFKHVRPTIYDLSVNGFIRATVSGNTCSVRTFSSAWAASDLSSALVRLEFVRG